MLSKRIVVVDPPGDADGGDGERVAGRERERAHAPLVRQTRLHGGRRRGRRWRAGRGTPSFAPFIADMIPFQPKPMTFMKGIVRWRGTTQKFTACAGTQYAHSATSVSHPPSSPAPSRGARTKGSPRPTRPAALAPAASAARLSAAIRAGTATASHSPPAQLLSPKNAGR